VNVETPEVPGTDDQVDVVFSVEEQPSGSISATLGYAQSAGLIVGAGYQESNVLGTGNSLSLQISWSEYQRAVSFNFFDPYFTLDGISRGYNMFYRDRLRRAEHRDVFDGRVRRRRQLRLSDR
jgi:outer membrane protein insertion porin family